MAKDYFADVYQTHMHSIYRYCLFRTNSYQDAEDITAEVFIRFLANQNKIRQDYVLPWLFKVASNLCINHGRKIAKVGLLEEWQDLTYEDKQLPWRDEEVWLALRNLHLKQQQVIYLRVIEDMSFKDIAAFLSRKEGAVKMLYYRGIKALENILKEDHGDV